MSDIAARIEEFRRYIAAEHGLQLVGEFKADGRFHGARSDQDRHGAKPFRYCVHLDEPANVYFVDLKRGFSGVWFPESRQRMSPAERERLCREAEARRLRQETEIRQWQEAAAAMARTCWRRSLPASPDHPYLVRKGVGVHGVRTLPIWERRIEREPGRFERIRIPNALLVPMRDEAGVLWNVRAVFPEIVHELDRDKDFPPRARKKGLFHWIGERTETVCLAEGYATAASIHEATGYRAIVCFDAGNLPVVAETVREMLPQARIVIRADHDRAGLAKGTDAAARVDGFIALPPNPGMDFNDWAARLREAGRGG